MNLEISLSLNFGQAYQMENSLDEKLKQTVYVVMDEGVACSAPDVLYMLQNYHKRALNSIQNQSPTIDSDVILIRPQKSEFVFCQKSNDYKWSEVRFFCLKLERVYFIVSVLLHFCSP